MHIDEILGAISVGDAPLITEDWGQGRTTFGGLTGAILCQALMREVDNDRLLRAMEISFTRPFEAMKSYQIDIETLAQGKTVLIRQARLVQDGKIRAVARADFVRLLDSDVNIGTFAAPDMKAADASVPLAAADLPEFFGRFEASVATPAMPFSQAEVPELGGWMKFAEPPIVIREPHLVCLIDSWPPTASPYYQGFKPLSTVSWSVHFAHPAVDVDPANVIGYRSVVNFGEGGISSSSADIWHPTSGQLLAKSVQTSIIYG